MDQPGFDTPPAFTVADGSRHGLSRGSMRSRNFVAPWRGARIVAARADDTFVRAYAAQLQRPDAVVSHFTAADLLGLPVRCSDRLHLTTDADKAPQAKARAQQTGVIAHRSTLTSQDTLALASRVINPSYFEGGRTGIEQVTAPSCRQTPDAVRVTTPLRTWIDLGAQGLSIAELVAVGDALISNRFAYCTRDQVLDAVHGLRRMRGVRNLRQAATLIRSGTDSVKETELRLAIVNAGFPEPEINISVCDPVTGAFIAKPDLQYRRLRIAIEYDGDHHRVDRKQWQHDLVRNEGLIELGWRVLLATDLSLAGSRLSREFFDRLRRAIDERQR